MSEGNNGKFNWNKIPSWIITLGIVWCFWAACLSRITHSHKRP